MQNFHDHELDLVLDESAKGVIRVVWKGQSTGRNPAQTLRPWFDGLYLYAKSHSARVEMDFISFEHFNSSTISALVHIINTAREQGIGLTVRYDKAVRWQSLSFEALSRAIRPFEKGSPIKVEFIPVSVPVN